MGKTMGKSPSQGKTPQLIAVHIELSRAEEA